MGVSTIALYASSSGSVCSASHQISSHVSYDLDVNGRSTSTASASASPGQKSFVGGLSCLFSSPQVKSSSSSSGGEELGSQWHDRSEKLGSSYRYSSLSSSLKRDQPHQSPVSVLHGFENSVGSGSRASPPTRMNADLGTVRSRSGGMFNGFVGNALQMNFKDVDWCPPSIALPTDDLTFNMDDEFDAPSDSKDLLVGLQSGHSIFMDDMVVKAFYLAEKAHRGQKRASGHPYLNHCVETALMLANIGATSTVVAAGLLHDTIDDSLVTYHDISASLGVQVADLVEGVSKLSQLSKLARENNTASKTVEADRLHTMFLAMADARAVLIKLADRLHNMQTLDALPLIKQQRISKETLEIFVPLANRLGIWTWKDELENLCFKYLYPDNHEELCSFVKSFDKSVISSSSAKLELALKAEGISFHSLSGRHKSLYSIHCKMLKKKLSIDEIHDIYGLRLIVENEEDCYKALKLVHQLWHEVPGKFKDYIIHPKFNGYQSLHTVVEGEGTVPLEVQIRTKEMHLQAEYGLAAHWRYKEGGKQSSFILQMVEWARWVVSWQCEEMCKDGSSIAFVDSIKPQCTFPAHSKDCSFSCNLHSGPDGRIFVILIENEKMSVQEYPAESSMMDLLETNGRGSCMGTGLSSAFHLKEKLMPQLNHRPVVDPSQNLKMGDVVELTPAIPSESLTVYRKEIQRMYDNGGGLQPRRPVVPAAP